MQSKSEIRVNLEALGLSVDDTGVIRGHDGEAYGMMSNLGLVLSSPVGHRNNIVLYEDLVAVGMMDDGTLNLETESGRLAFCASGHGTRDAPQVDGSRASIETAFPLVFPNWRECMWHDELTDTDMVDLALFGRPSEVVAADDSVMALYHREMDKGLRRLTGARIRVSETVMDEAWTLAMMESTRNPFREWMESHEWDGTPRLRTWFLDYLGATAFPLTGAEEREYIEAVTTAWFMGAVARQYGEVKHEVVPVLLGDQGIGKGSVLKFTAGADRWYKDTSSNITDPRRFLEGVNGAVIVEMSEASQIRSKTSEELKAFISQSSDTYRDPYGRKARTHLRRFVLVASTNLRTVFTDVTGNRRFYPIECHGERATKAHSRNRLEDYQHEVEQLWAEALAMFRMGEPASLSPDMGALASKVQDGASVENPSIDDINDLLDNPYNDFSKVGDIVSRTDITDLLQQQKGYLLREAQAAYQVWTQSRKEWVKLEKPRRVGERTKRGWVRISRAGDMPDPVRVPSAEYDGLELRLRAIVKKAGAAASGYPCDGSCFTDEELARLKEQGLIVMDGDGSRWFPAEAS